LVELGTQNIAFAFPPTDLIYQNLQLIYGVGSATAHRLKEAGYRNITELTGHSRWGKAARELLSAIQRQDIHRLMDYGASDLELLSFFQPEEITFIDIETTGLFYMFPVFLIGILQFKNGKGQIRQFLARNFDEEGAILAELDQAIRNQGIITSYNGKSFDIPYLKGRLRFHNLEDRFDAFHLDLLRHARRKYRPELPDCRLTTIERMILNQVREGDLPGSEVPEFYRLYMETGDRFYIDPIMKHNACDLLALAKLLGILIPVNREKAVADGY
jgi:uncharacterized protein YprB with RNaseH-like and TPR domain